MTKSDWVMTSIVVLFVSINCLFIWWKGCVEYIDDEDEEYQGDVNVQYINNQMRKKQIKSTVKKINK